MRVFFKNSKREKYPKSHPQEKKNPPFLCFDRVPLEFVELSSL